MAKLPEISVNIPVRTGGDFSIVLDSLRKVDYPKDLFEIIIVQGNNVGKQRNLAIKKSTGSIVYFLDDDSRINPKAFRIVARKLSKATSAAAGGPSLTDKKNGSYFNELVALALETMFGAVRMRYRYSSQPGSRGTEFRLIGANLALKKKVVVQVGMFNEKIYPCDETELLRRIKDFGYEIVYSRKLFIYRNQRKNVIELIRQFHFYGTGRAKQILRNAEISDLVFSAPILFAVYLVTIPFFYNFLYLLPLILYFTLAFATSLKATIKYKKLNLLIFLTAIFPLIHISYALGLVHGLLGNTNKSHNESKHYKLKTMIIKKFKDSKF